MQQGGQNRHNSLFPGVKSRDEDRLDLRVLTTKGGMNLLFSAQGHYDYGLYIHIRERLRRMNHFLAYAKPLLFFISIEQDISIGGKGGIFVHEFII